MTRWRITIEAWPHSTGHGATADQEAVGEREQYFYVDAEEIGEAFKMARCYSEGVCANPAVWKAPIMGVHRYNPNSGTDCPRSREDQVRAYALRSAAEVARNGCLVPPDGGSPTAAEVELCDLIANAILRLE